MKIPADTVAALQAAIAPFADKLEAHAASLASNPKVGNLAMRVRWDAFWASKFDASPIYRAGCNDTHIDTALRSVMRNLGFPQFAS